MPDEYTKDLREPHDCHACRFWIDDASGCEYHGTLATSCDLFEWAEKEVADKLKIKRKTDPLLMGRPELEQWIADQFAYDRKRRLVIPREYRAWTIALNKLTETGLLKLAILMVKDKS